MPGKFLDRLSFFWEAMQLGGRWALLCASAQSPAALCLSTVGQGLAGLGVPPGKRGARGAALTAGKRLQLLGTC